MASDNLMLRAIVYRDAQAQCRAANRAEFHAGMKVKIRLSTCTIEGVVHGEVADNPDMIACLLEHGDVREYLVEQVSVMAKQESAG